MFSINDAATTEIYSLSLHDAPPITQICPPPTSVQINCGGPAVSPFVAEEFFAGGGTINHANTIDLSGVTNPAPMAGYQTARIGRASCTDRVYNAEVAPSVKNKDSA